MVVGTRGHSSSTVILGALQQLEWGLPVPALLVSCCVMFSRVPPWASASFKTEGQCCLPPHLTAVQSTEGTPHTTTMETSGSATGLSCGVLRSPHQPRGQGPLAPRLCRPPWRPALARLLKLQSALPTPDSLTPSLWPVFFGFFS